MTKTKIMKIANTDEDAENWITHTLLEEMQNSIATVAIKLSVLIIQSNNFILGYLS